MILFIRVWLFAMCSCVDFFSVQYCTRCSLPYANARKINLMRMNMRIRCALHLNSPRTQIMFNVCGFFAFFLYPSLSCSPFWLERKSSTFPLCYYYILLNGVDPSRRLYKSTRLYVHLFSCIFNSACGVFSLVLYFSGCFLESHVILRRSVVVVLMLRHHHGSRCRCFCSVVLVSIWN